MKRSEAIKELHKKLDEHSIQEIHPDQILEWVMALGMQPPSYRAEGYSGIRADGVYYEDPDYLIPEWEEE